MLCDDEIHIIRARRVQAARAGYEVESASDGQSAGRRSEPQTPDLLITDCQMPRLSGLRLIERVRANPATTTCP